MFPVLGVVISTIPGFDGGEYPRELLHTVTASELDEGWQILTNFSLFFLDFFYDFLCWLCGPSK